MPDENPQATPPVVDHAGRAAEKLTAVEREADQVISTLAEGGIVPHLESLGVRWSNTIDHAQAHATLALVREVAAIRAMIETFGSAVPDILTAFAPFADRMAFIDRARQSMTFGDDGGGRVGYVPATDENTPAGPLSAPLAAEQPSAGGDGSPEAHSGAEGVPPIPGGKIEWQWWSDTKSGGRWMPVGSEADADELSARHYWQDPLNEGSGRVRSRVVGPWIERPAR
jgi:hypothetical protein